MKRFFLALVFMVAVSAVIRAEDVGTKPFWGPYHVWKTTITSTDDRNVKVASGSFVVRSIMIGTPGASSKFELFDGSASTTTATRLFSTIDTTAKFTYPTELIYGTSGFMYNNIGAGAADVTVEWDWFDTASVNKR